MAYLEDFEIRTGHCGLISWDGVRSRAFVGASHSRRAGNRSCGVAHSTNQPLLLKCFEAFNMIGNRKSTSQQQAQKCSRSVIAQLPSSLGKLLPRRKIRPISNILL